MFALVFRVQPVLFKKAAENLILDNLQVAAREQICRDLPFLLEEENSAMNVVVKWRFELVWIIKKCVVYLYTYNSGVVDSYSMLISCLR